MSERRLPMAEPGGAPPPPVQVTSSSVRLVGTLAAAGALAGLAIVLVFQWARPRIEAHQARVLAEAVTEVLGGPERWATVFVENGELTAAPRADTSGLDRVYVGYDVNDDPVGIALVAAEAGFQDVIRLIFGYDPGTGDVLGMKVLESKETPGLGDKIEKDSSFIGEFADVGWPLLGVKKGRATGAHEEVVMITGATISSRAVIDIINHRLDVLRDPLGRFWASPRALGAARPDVGQGAVASEGGAPTPTPGARRAPTPGGDA